MSLTHIHQQIDAGDEVVHIDDRLLLHFSRDHQPLAYISVKLVTVDIWEIQGHQQGTKLVWSQSPLGGKLSECTAHVLLTGLEFGQGQSLPCRAAPHCGGLCRQNASADALHLIQGQPIHLVEMPKPFLCNFRVEVQVQACTHTEEGMDFQLATVVFVKLSKGQINRPFLQWTQLLVGPSLCSWAPHHRARGGWSRTWWRNSPGRQRHFQDIRHRHASGDKFPGSCFMGVWGWSWQSPDGCRLWRAHPQVQGGKVCSET
mmetsp:Transcript_40933/g.88689  ORF Transcript_40933/g.88689 Transcript_40933/m.88689 type:complete len:259 (+) Transcript_40933:96-872(+)